MAPSCLTSAFYTNQRTHSLQTPDFYLSHSNSNTNTLVYYGCWISFDSITAYIQTDTNTHTHTHWTERHQHDYPNIQLEGKSAVYWSFTLTNPCHRFSRMWNQQSTLSHKVTNSWLSCAHQITRTLISILTLGLPLLSLELTFNHYSFTANQPSLSDGADICLYNCTRWLLCGEGKNQLKQEDLTLVREQLQNSTTVKRYWSLTWFMTN